MTGPRCAGSTLNSMCVAISQEEVLVRDPCGIAFAPDSRVAP